MANPGSFLRNLMDFCINLLSQASPFSGILRTIKKAELRKSDHANLNFEMALLSFVFALGLAQGGFQLKHVDLRIPVPALVWVVVFFFLACLAYSCYRDWRDIG